MDVDFLDVLWEGFLAVGLRLPWEWPFGCLTQRPAIVL